MISEHNLVRQGSGYVNISYIVKPRLQGTSSTENKFQGTFSLIEYMSFQYTNLLHFEQKVFKFTLLLIH
jgi:hypothetical protein